uniref:NADH-ubiquinone oxidoreductase chain 2 n=1 Tax=Trigonopterus sp. 4 AH-2016 TaxID=1903838 RepID=A0A343C411_9CUCU|nr:NADH dehydrogenase subunit 2 [Trigonopterus sp. 4 AH-2016]
MFNFFKMLFFTILISSTLISISALSWITAWIGLEMNLMAIIPLMKTNNNKFAAEASIKYFIIQAMASSCLLFSIMLLSSFSNLNFKFMDMSSILMNLALLLKMGCAPLHFWLPEICSGLNWSINLMILTWQKIAPMILLSYTILYPSFISAIIITTAIISGVQGINQICLRKIMAYSSINHMGWMLCALLNSLNLWFYYFSIYLLITLNILIMFNKYKTFYLNQLTKMLTPNKTLKLLFMLNFLSLGGLPPFLGFLPKWLTIYMMVETKFFLVSFTLVILSLLTLYFYTRITFSSLTFKYSESSILSKPKLKNFYFFWNLIILSSLPLSFTLTNYI